jgi:hypothetical protein
MQELFELVVHGKLFLLATLFFKAEQKPFPGRIIVFDLQVHDGADPGESVGKDSKQSDRGARYEWIFRSRPEASEPRLRRMRVFCLRSVKISRSR